MSFCSKCGQKIAEGAQFCSGCGEKIGMQPISQEKNIEKQEQRKVAFDGEVHKCPNCGEVIKKSFQTVCHKCNFELRSVNSSKAVRELNERLELANNEKKKIEIIKNFPIPNTKEDIFEFMILASSNFDASYYATHLQEEDISDAWLVKIEQCYQKAKLIFANQSDLDNIGIMYEKIISNVQSCKLAEEKKIAQKQKAEIKKEKQKNNKKRNDIIVEICGFVFIIIVCLIPFIFGGGINADPNAIKVGISFEEVKGQYYEDIIDAFEIKGFTNIEAREDGWHLLHKSKTIKKVTIDGKEEFYSYSKFSKDAKIIIFYYK